MSLYVKFDPLVSAEGQKRMSYSRRTSMMGRQSFVGTLERDINLFGTPPSNMMSGLDEIFTCNLWMSGLDETFTCNPPAENENEEIYKNGIAGKDARIENVVMSCNKLAKQAEEKLSEACGEIEKIENSKLQEVTRLDAEVKMLKFQKDGHKKIVEQRELEIEELTQLCNELSSLKQNDEFSLKTFYTDVFQITLTKNSD